jgi:hypothetical protein
LLTTNLFIASDYLFIIRLSIYEVACGSKLPQLHLWLYSSPGLIAADAGAAEHATDSD